MTKIKCGMPNGIEFEADVDNPKEWAKALKDIRFVNIQNKKNEALMPDGKKLVNVSYDLYQKVQNTRHGKESWEDALLREMSRAKASEIERHVTAQLRDIKELLHQANEEFDFIKARIEKRAYGGKSDE